MSTAKALLLLIGTNTVRCIPATLAVQQVAFTINYIHEHHTHLKHKRQVAVVLAFPCLKPTSSFPSTSLLLSNIVKYNEDLKQLSTDLNFTFIDFNVDVTYLADDQMHLHFNHRHLVLNSIQQHFLDLAQYQPRVHAKIRSRTARRRRNKRRHDQMKVNRQQFIIHRNISPHWLLKNVKQYLIEHNIKYARLPEVQRHVLCIQFNNPVDRDYADSVLPLDVFTNAQSSTQLSSSN